jgi:hypothetical protein
MPQTLKLKDKRDLRPAETALALGMHSRALSWARDNSLKA